MSETSRKVRTLFLSDIHLGAKASNATALLDFLREHQAEKIVLVGDIVDGWKLKRHWHWPQSHNDVVQKLLRQARKGVEMVYVPGNHDEFARDFQGLHFGGIEVIDRTIHETADGRRLLVIHGDQFDVVVMNARLLAHLGDWAYVAAINLNRFIAMIRRAFGLPYWSFSAWAKLRVKRAVNFIGSFEKTLAAEARKQGLDGVICGHIHHAAIETIDGDVTYVNTGDWVESCTAIVEHFDGRLELIRWMDILAEREAKGRAADLRALPAPKTQKAQAA
ncbi:UDP-2,3-diacylglucosamine diphosphatase [Notoacmeibacter sp. MSK16QG-6]|uniref:UDP-2,3-diacylglucosamine diphosphatase n=1 Tax=Notoacmeibacter sp. MSK16QG-6 TaxID=2957982 RepID=UPI0020A19AF0|nr:UDP-2,3-diacylglucosamine diphosphatase [Notoacmeibacter sp. MSK16QG-6]MCP1199136.1 UDP-2,3-diacylglucosamine diphosphatase [Notoacmeibacter sp. MSK16QG-6]